MNLARYTGLRLFLYFVVFSLLISTCHTVWPGAGLGKWYFIAGLAILFTAMEYYMASRREPTTQCIMRNHLEEVQSKLNSLGYKMTDNEIDSLVYLRKVNPVYWDIAAIRLKKNCIILEIPEREVHAFSAWAVNTSKVVS
jgi:hypothetical protein